jgi:hypothetical protein
LPLLTAILNGQTLSAQLYVSLLPVKYRQQQCENKKLH